MEKKDQKKNKMTLDKLAGMVQRGFVDLEDRLGKRIDGVETRLSGVETRLSGVETRLSGVETRLDNVVTEISDMKKEISKKLDYKVEKVEYTKLERRVCILENVAEKPKNIDR